MRDSAPTAYVDGDQLYFNVKQAVKDDEPDQSYAYGTALGYILGVADAQSASLEMPTAAWAEYQVPLGISGRQALEAVCAYLREHPLQRCHQSARLVLEALAEAFPSKDSGADSRI